MSMGGVNRVGAQTPQVQTPQTVAKPAPGKPVATPQRLDGKQFSQLQNNVKLPTTNVNALTQLPSQDQQQILKLTQDQQMNKFVDQMSQAQKEIRNDVPPRSLLGAGQSIPPAPMRAAAAALGKVFSGRDFEIEVDREFAYMSFKVGGKSFNITINTPLKEGIVYDPDDEFDDEDDIEESL